MLRYRADLRSIGFVATYFLVVVAVYSVDAPLPDWWWAALPIVVGLSLLSFFCAVITHNTVHSPVFRNRGLNRAFQVALSLTYGHPVSMFVPGHNLSHHKYLQDPRDRMRTDKLRFRWNLLNQLFFAAAVGPTIFGDNARFARAMSKKNPKWFRQFVLELVFYIGFLALTLALDWQKFILFILIPHQYAAWGIMGINFVQHDGCDAEHPYNHSRNFVGTWVNWFTFNNGYHGIHHMYPGLHWSLLPERHAQEVAPHIHPELDQKSLLAYLFKAYVWPGRRVRYDGTPVVLGPPRQDEDWLPSALRENPESGEVAAPA
jgi:fatty acid desaturase